VSHRVTCPHCSAPLRLPDGFLPAFAGCPRCLGKVPNPELPDDIEIADSGGVPALAMDDEAEPDAQQSRRGVLYPILLILFGVFSGGGLCGLLEATNNNIFAGFSTTGIGLLTFLALCPALILPFILIRLPRSRIIRQAPPGAVGRVLAVLVLWVLLSTLALATVFVAFLLAYLGGTSIGDALR
jgi:hypothetical protein